jgi:hypothetical protein
MPITTAFIRVFTALLLSVPALLGFGYYFVATGVDDTLLDADFVAGSLQRARVYERIHILTRGMPERTGASGKSRLALSSAHGQAGEGRNSDGLAQARLADEEAAKIRVFLVYLRQRRC